MQVLEIRRKKLGIGHPHTLLSMQNLASTFKLQGNISRAISLKEEACQSQAVVLGPEHPDTIAYSEQLATWRQEVDQIIEQKGFILY